MKTCSVETEVAIQVLRLNSELGYPACPTLHNAALEVSRVYHCVHGNVFMFMFTCVCFCSFGFDRKGH